MFRAATVMKLRRPECEEQPSKRVPEILEIADAYEGPHRSATIYLNSVEAGVLARVDIDLVHEKLRKRLDRADFKGAMLVGGTEAEWKQRKKRWIIHVHLLSIGPSRADWERFRARFPEVAAAIPLEVNRLRHAARQVSYMNKWVTYHRPGKQVGNRRPAPFPLPPDRLAELARWWTQYRFEDFLFVYGARRRGRRLVPNA